MAYLGNTIVSGTLKVLNDVNANKVSGDGSGLTSLNASNISSGTLNAARLPASYLPLTGGTLTNQLIIQATTSGNYNEGIRINKSGNSWAGLIIGSNANSTSGAPNASGGWFVAQNTANQLIINNVDSTTTNASLWINTDKTVNIGKASITTLNGVTVGSSPKFTDTTYSGANGISLSGTTFSNSGVRSIATGSANGTISVNTNGTAADVAVKGLGTAAYTASTAYAAASHNHDGRYIYWGGTSSNNSAWLWGTLTVANGYTQHSHLIGDSGCEGGFASKGGQLNMQLDGYFYQREGAYRCLDTADSSSFAAASHTHNYAGSSSAGGAATSVVTTSVTADADKNIYFVNGSNTVGYNANLVHNPSVGLLKTKSIGTTDSHLFAFVDGGFYDAGGGVTGALCITLPVSWTATMMSFQATIYNYADNDSTTYFISGYNYNGGNGSWVSCTAHAIGKRILNVRFGHNGTKCVIIIGETNTTWSYPKLVISNLLIGHSGIVDKTWCTGWSIAPITTLPSNISKVIDPGVNLTRAMTAATASAAGLTGLVPAPAAGKQTSFLRGDGTWVIPTNTTYSANNGVSLSGTTFSNSGVRSVATGSTNGTISVNTNGTAADVAVKGLGSAAYTASTAYAAASHGNHVPATQTANNAVFLRNDNSWQTVTPANIGAAASSHTHNYAGSASAGGAANSLLNFTAGTSSAGEHNANNIKSNGVWYYTSNGPAKTLGASTDDGGLYSQAYSTAWAGQIAQDYRNGNLFVRGLNNGTWTSWLPVLTTASTLDATKLSGLTKAQVTTALGYTPPTTNTTYTANNGVSLSGTTFSNSGVRSIATGSANGTISVNTNGTAADVAVKGLGSAAYTASTAYAAASHTHNYAGSSSAGGAATSATTLTTARYIDGVSFNGSADISHYGECTVAAGTQAKTVVCTGFALKTGSRIVVKFTNGNTHATPTLNVNSTGAKNIYYKGAAVGANVISAGHLVEMIYDGTQYQMLGNWDMWITD